jgi:hypothetical protein
MKRFRRPLLSVALALVTLFFPLLTCPHRIDEAHHELIRTGMTEAEVEAIFGAPAGNYDWAVAERLRYRYMITAIQAHNLQVLNQVVNVNEAVAPNFVTVNELIGATRPQPMSIWLDYSDHMRTWTSRHGSFTLWFDDHGKVTSTGHRVDVRFEMPWQRWWKEHVAK